jgi:hypothetical protein
MSRETIRLLFARMANSVRDEESRRVLLREAEKLDVKRTGSSPTIGLGEIIALHPNQVYVTYPPGPTVEPITTVDGMDVYGRLEVELASLQSLLVAQRGEIVLQGSR